jgi:hypothetical protein
MAIEGYKAFYHDMTNNYGMKFEVGKSYHMDGPIKFGPKGNGFHMCTNMEDTCRYIEDPDMKIARVKGFGTITEGFDDYNEYYDMYAVSDITICNLVLREEVIKHILECNELRACRFINTGFMLTEKEIEQFRRRYRNASIVDNCIRYAEAVRYPKMMLKKR